MDDFQNGLFQGAQVYNPDNGIDALIASISGRLFKLDIVGSTASLTDVTITSRSKRSFAAQGVDVASGEMDDCHRWNG